MNEHGPVHEPLLFAPDVADLMDLSAEDPLPDEVTDVGDPSWVPAADDVLPALDFPDTDVWSDVAAPRGLIYAGYQSAARCTDGPTVGCRNLMSWFLGGYGRLGAVNTGIYNCLAGETLVMTPDGDVPIVELAGTTARLLTFDAAARKPAPRWVDAPVRWYGKQRLMRLTLRRGPDVQVVHATAGHRWLTRYRRSGVDGGGHGYTERTTDGLREGHVIPTVLPRSGASRIRSMGAGVPHGLVYGDGSLDGTGGSRMDLVGAKNLPLAEWFPNAVRSVGTTPGEQPHAVITGLSRTWKRLPGTDESAAYLYGFLAGWFAADGRVQKNGAATLYCADRTALEQARVLARKVGISTMPIRTGKSGGNLIRGRWVEQGELYSLTFVGTTLDSSFFLIPEHRERWDAAPRRRGADGWTVVDVATTDRVEDVFCAEVAGTETFVLAEGVLTRNCRTVRGGTTTSLHGEGRAADLGIRPYSAAWGTTLADALRLKSRELGIQCLIWNRRIWSGSYPNAGWRPYSGVASHTDHIHTELSWRTARDAPLTVAYIAQVMGGATPVGPPVTPTGGGAAGGARLLKLTSPRMEGEDVRLVQRVLRAWYGLPAEFVDGAYGPGTVAQVKRAQAGAPPAPVLDPDGRVGPLTRAKLGIRT